MKNNIFVGRALFQWGCRKNFGQKLKFWGFFQLRSPLKCIRTQSQKSHFHLCMRYRKWAQVVTPALVFQNVDWRDHYTFRMQNEIDNKMPCVIKGYNIFLCHEWMHFILISKSVLIKNNKWFMKKLSSSILLFLSLIDDILGGLETTCK